MAENPATPEDEIDITPEMIDAGAEELCDWAMKFYDTIPVEWCRDEVGKILKAVFQSGSKSVKIR